MSNGKHKKRERGRGQAIVSIAATAERKRIQQKRVTGQPLSAAERLLINTGATREQQTEALHALRSSRKKKRRNA